MDVYEFAMQMELDGKAYYEKLAAQSTVEGFAAIFTRLAMDEQKHYETVQAMKSGTAAIMAETTVLEDAKNVFEQMKGKEAMPETMKDNLQAYEHAKEVEAKSVRLYEDMADQELRTEVAALLRRMAEEEKKHFNIMENVCDFVLRPKYYLEWMEFSNLGQL